LHSQLLAMHSRASLLACALQYSCTRACSLPLHAARCLLPAGRAVRSLATRSERAAAQAAAAAPTGLAEIEAMFARLQAGLVGMAEENPGFSVRREGSALVISTGRSVLRVAGDPATGQLTYSSPKVGHGGGTLTYRLNKLTGHWCCTADGHFLIELLTRELIFHVPGGL
jgi:hypothetical protein